MKQYTPFKDITIGKNWLQLLLEDETPVVEFDFQTFNHIWILNQHLPSLSDPLYIKEFAEIANFLWKGLSFTFIDQIEEYKKFYIEHVELEKQHPSDVFPFRLTDYQIFDVSVMHDPKIEKNLLHFFVYQTATAIPYQVVCPFPYDSSSTVVRYQILPIKQPVSSS